MPSLVLDTNVIVSSLRSSLGASYRIVNLIDQGAFDLGLTASLVLEYEAVCKRLSGELSITEAEVDAFVDYLCGVGKRSIVHYQVRPAVHDPDDDMVLEAAIASGSNWIVTHNVRDLSGSAQFGIEVLTPSQALQRLGVSR